MSKVVEFTRVYRMYHAHHQRAYALRMAWRIAIEGLPF
jgi:hypothetical protein